MAEVAKTIYVFGACALTEASYGAGGSPAPATDGVLLDANPEVTVAYANDGTRAMPPGTQGYQPRAVPSGRTGSGSFKVRMAGAGVAYSATKKPRAHTLLRAAGFDPTLDATVGAEKYTYALTPGPTGYSSAVLDLYSRGEKQTLSGAYADWSLAADGDEIPLWDFTLHGLLGLPTDVAVPAITYDSVVGPKSVGTLLTLGLATGLIVRKWSLKGGREINPRINQNTAAGHAGFAIGKRTPQLDITVEASTRPATPYNAASALDPDQLFEHASSLAWQLAIGSVQYNKCTVAGPAAQLMAAPKLNADGPTALWELSLQLNPSALGLNDELSLVYA